MPFKLNPLTGQFDLVNEAVASSGNTIEIVDLRNCAVSVALGDLVTESTSIVNGVDTAPDNLQLEPIVGIVITKPSTVTCEVLFLGKRVGYTGLSKGKKIFLSPTGTVTSTPPTSGYLQCIGTAIDINSIYFRPNMTRTKRI